jgi:hypothetical protein
VIDAEEEEVLDREEVALAAEGLGMDAVQRIDCDLIVEIHSNETFFTIFKKIIISTRIISTLTRKRKLRADSLKFLIDASVSLAETNGAANGSLHEDLLGPEPNLDLELGSMARWTKETRMPHINQPIHITVNKYTQRQI